MKRQKLQTITLTMGSQLIAMERQRQIEFEGFTEEHDSEHTDGSIAMAAACYLYEYYSRVENLRAYYHNQAFTFWPWDDKWYKPSKDNIILLKKAGALIAAEIDRIIATIGKGGKTK